MGLRVPPSELNRFFQVKPNAITLAGSTVTSLVGAAGNRIALMLTADTTTPYRIWFDTTVNSGKGILVAQNTVPLVFDYNTFGAMVTMPLWVFSTGTPVIAFVEVLFGQGIAPLSVEGE